MEEEEKQYNCPGMLYNNSKIYVFNYVITNKILKYCASLKQKNTQDTLPFHCIKVLLYQGSKGKVNSVSKLTINPHFLLYGRKED
jgi:hypothetical protein